MRPVNSEALKSAIRDIPDFPRPGIIFKDITPILGDAALFGGSIDLLAEEAEKCHPSRVVGIDARGFVFGAAVAYKLGLSFVPVRKRGKLPYETVNFSYTLEYGEADMEIHVDAIRPHERIVLVDDLLATGGTSGAAIQLVKRLGGEVAAALFLIELTFLKGRERLFGVPTHALISY